jgi:hypothetical protein
VIRKCWLQHPGGCEVEQGVGGKDVSHKACVPW